MYLLDVSSHGVPAVLRSVTLGRMLVPMPGQPSPVERLTPGVTLEPRPPHEVVAESNGRAPMAERDGHDFTVVYAVLESSPSSVRVRYTSAGHPPPMVVSNNAADGIRSALGADFAVGWFAEAICDEHTLKLQPGDHLFLISDGVTESMGERAGLFGKARLAVAIPPAG